jgi:hypothetical protein
MKACSLEETLLRKECCDAEAERSTNIETVNAGGFQSLSESMEFMFIGVAEIHHLNPISNLKFEMNPSHKSFLWVAASAATFRARQTRAVAPEALFRPGPDHL